MPASAFPGPIRQVGYVTDDLARDLEAFSRAGVGPFQIFLGLRLPGTFRGEQTTIEMNVAFSFQGQLQLELIEQTNDAPSPYLAHRKAGIAGPHHIAYLSDDFESDLARARVGGFELAASLGGKTVGRYAYVVPAGAHGPYFELLENTPATRAQWASQIERCARWDGDRAANVVVDLRGVVLK